MKRECSQYFLAALVLIPIILHASSLKQTVGATEIVFIEDAHLSFKARIDTGAKTSSIHAEKIEVDSSDDVRGKAISFYLVDREGRSRKVETRVVSIVKVKTSEHSEYRYVVPLIVKWNDSRKTVHVNLNNRKSMNYHLLLGRNWLQGDFIVDVDLNSED